MNNRSLFDGQFVKLTALDPEKDSGELSKWTNSPEFVNRNLEGFFRQHTVSELKKKFKEILKKADENHQDYYFAVREKESNQLVGLLHFGWLLLTHQTGRLFLDFANEEAWSKFAQETLQMALRFGFMELSLHRLYLCVPAHNIDEMTLYEEAGFLRETQRREAVFYDGKYYDELLYGLLRDEWKALEKEVTQ